MRTQLQAAEIEHYGDNGFVILEDFLTPDELEGWRAAVMEAVEERGDVRIPGFQGDSGGFYGRVFLQRVNLWQTSARMKALMLDERLGRLAAELAGVDGIRIWHDQTLIKGPWANPTAWHLDVPYWSFSSRDALSIWVALDDVTLENGCLFFLPGTHREATFDNVGIGQNMGELFQVYPQWATREAVAAPMRAGSCSFHNGLTAHGAHANMTPYLRRAMTCAYMPDGSRFNGKQNILRPEQLARLSVGDPLDDDAQNPLLFSRSSSGVGCRV